ncbi:MAG: transposase [bacterium]
MDIDRFTLAFWVGKAAHELKPAHDALLADLKQSTKLFMPSQ